jgi:acetolactate synthase-1/2/3 large subunit
MGFALPAGIGAVMAAPGNRAIVIAGDGGIQINIQELDTIAKHRLPVKIFIMNNGCLGMVRQFQDMYFEGRRQSTVKGYNCPDLIAIAEAYGIPTRTIRTHDEAEAITSEVMGNGEPMLVDIKIDQSSCVNPKLEFNKPIEDMSPYLSKEELEANMKNDTVKE